MNVKKSWINQIRGWMPQGINLPRRQQATIPKPARNQLKICTSIFVTLAIVWGIQGALSPAFVPGSSWSLYFAATGAIIGVSFLILLIRMRQTRAIRR
jgi:hypothetical protein